MSAGSEEVVKTLDNLLSTLHTLAPLVRNTHWGVARGSDSILGQGLEPLMSFVISLDSRQAFFYTLHSSPALSPCICS